MLPLIVYIESCCSSRHDAVTTVCEAFARVFHTWIKPFSADLTCGDTVTTSSGQTYNLRELS